MVPLWSRLVHHWVYKNANFKISVADIVKSGGVSKVAVYKAIRAGKLTFKDGKADPVRLFAEWRSKRDPSRDDKIGPALEKIIRKMGLGSIPAAKKASSGSR